MDIKAVFDRFALELKRQAGILTEDNIRYFFFAKMMEEDPDLSHYTLELPYEAMITGQGNLEVVVPKGAGLVQVKQDKYDQELDMYYSNGEETLCIEVKFHRNGENESAYPHTLAAGSLFNDMHRLQIIESKEHGKVRKIFLYVTDEEMYRYLGNLNESSQNKTFRDMLKNFIGLVPGDSWNTIVPDKISPKTFTAASHGSFVSKDSQVSIDVKKIAETEVLSESPSVKGRKCHLMLYEIQ